jgi:hypothetical protein
MSIKELNEIYENTKRCVIVRRGKLIGFYKEVLK